MSSNPNNSVGTNGAYGGRTSVNALNDNLAAYSRGILSGWVCLPNSGLTVSLGGDGTTRDVAIAEDNAGNKTTINNISGSPIDVTLSAAPGSNSRIDSIVAYVDNPPQGVDNETDNPGACGIIAVSGNTAVNPTAPDDNTIRTAITADGASGTTAYYVVLANITVASGTTDITSSDIIAGVSANVITAGMLDLSGLQDSAGAPIKTATFNLGYGMSATLNRIGNMVVVNGSPINSTALPSGETSLGETCPAGFRPTGNMYVIGAIVTGPSNDADSCGWLVKQNGSMTLYVPGTTNIPVPNRVCVSGVWFTNDSWPA